MTLEDVISRFPGGRWQGGQYRCCCPAHDDQKPSLGIMAGADGRIILLCQAGCDTASVLAAVGLSFADVQPPPRNGADAGRNVEYRYDDADGNAIAVKVRTPDKGFFWRQPGGETGLNGHKPLLFGLPELLRSEPGELVLIVEGEKDVLTARRLGFVATTNPDGAAKEGQSPKWKEPHARWLAEHLRGRRFAVIPDQDAAGAAHASAVIKSLRRAGLSAFILELPGLPEKGDLSDWAEGHSHADLLSLVESVESTANQAQSDEGLGTKSGAVELLSGVASKIRFVMTDAAMGGVEFGLREQVSPFPLEALPATLARLAENAAPAIPVPPDFIAVPMLTICGAAIGRAFDVEVKRNSWWETARLWALVVGDPGTVKSPAFGIASAPLVARQNALHLEHREAVKGHAAAEQVYQCDLKSWKAERARGNQCQELPVAPAAPQPRHLFTDDGTVEGITRALYYNPRGLIFLRDELAGWVSGMNQFKQSGNDRQTWLSYWSGTARNTVRAAAEEFHVAAPFVAVCGTIQPELLGILEDERGRQDGFVHRVLFSFPEKLPQSNPRDRFIDPALVRAYAELVTKLLDLKCQVGEDGSPAPISLPLSLPAEEVWNDWLDRHCAEMNAPEFSPALVGPWAKLKGYCASYALIFYVVRCVEEGVAPSSLDPASVRRAIQMIDYHKSHARVAYPLMKATEESLEVLRAVKWMQRKGLKEITPRHLQQARICETADAGRKLLLAMEQRGYGSVEGEE